MSSTARMGSGTNGIKSIEVGSRVLAALEQGRGPLSLSEVALGSDMHPAKAHRYLASFLRCGLATQDLTTGTYDLGPTSRQLGLEALRRSPAARVVSPHAATLRDRTGHTVNVAVWGDAGPTLVRWDTGAHALPIVVRVGSVLPLLDSAIGHVFLAYLPAPVTRDSLQAQQARGTTRVLSTAEIGALTSSIRADGLSRTRDGMIFGLAALAAPVFAATGDLAAVLGLVLPSQTMGRAQSTHLSSELRLAADRASAALAHGPWTPRA